MVSDKRVYRDRALIARANGGMRLVVYERIFCFSYVRSTGDGQ